eukprot:29686-Eustigmatos_ZCMA.PRE.1
MDACRHRTCHACTHSMHTCCTPSATDIPHCRRSYHQLGCRAPFSRVKHAGDGRVMLDSSSTFGGLPTHVSSDPET